MSNSPQSSPGLLCPSPPAPRETPRTYPRATVSIERPRVQGKFIFIGNEKFYIRGVTYGTFRPSKDGSEYRTPEVVERDFALMAANGITAIRTCTVPPRWLLDIAHSHG